MPGFKLNLIHFCLPFNVAIAPFKEVAPERSTRYPGFTVKPSADVMFVMNGLKLPVTFAVTLAALTKNVLFVVVSWSPTVSTSVFALAAPTAALKTTFVVVGIPWLKLNI